MIVKSDAIFRIEMNAGRMRKYPKTTPAGFFLKHAHSVPEQRDVASKPIYQESTDQHGLHGLQKLKRPGDRCKHTASVDIGDKDAWRLDAYSKSEVHEIAML